MQVVLKSHVIHFCLLFFNIWTTILLNFISVQIETKGTWQSRQSTDGSFTGFCGGAQGNLDWTGFYSKAQDCAMDVLVQILVLQIM